MNFNSLSSFAPEIKVSKCVYISCEMGASKFKVWVRNNSGTLHGSLEMNGQIMLAGHESSFDNRERPHHPLIIFTHLPKKRIWN